MGKIRDALPVAALLLAIFLLYRPGLTGGWLFDDFSNIVENHRLALTTLDASALNAAFWSGDAGPLGRPISMVSFALNHYFSGFDPYYFRLTNLFIHLINTILVCWLARSLLNAFAGGRETAFTPPPRLPLHGAWLAAAIWGLHPLNLTGVLYAVQRMTSLSALFGLLALGLYAAWRSSSRPCSALRGALIGLAIALALLASVYSKESGMLFVPLLLWVELLVFKGMREGRPIPVGSFTLRQLLWAGCALAALAVLFMLPPHLAPERFYHREFTLAERVMTECRVLFYYLRLFFLPSLSELSLYHDDFVISQSLLQPWTTSLSALGLLFITLATALLRKKFPLLLFAWGWFLIGHALESTVFSLELVHEHRNYFATVGFAVAIPWLLWRAPPKIRSFAILSTGLFVVFCGFITYQRALVWSEPLIHAKFEAETHPLSERANLHLGNVYARYLVGTKDVGYMELARLSWEKARKAYNAGNGGWFALIHKAYDRGETPDPELVRGLARRLREAPFANGDVGSLSAFASCQIKGDCRMPHHEAVSLLAAALENPRSNNIARAQISKIVGNYFVAVIADFEKGEEFLRDALAFREDVNGHLLLTQVLRLGGKLDRAREQLDRARRLDGRNAWKAEIEREQKLLLEAEQAARNGAQPADIAPPRQ